MELALVSGCAFLLLLTSSFIGTLARSLLNALLADRDLPEIVSRLCEAVAFCWGLVALISWFLQQPKLKLLQQLTGIRWISVKTCVVSVLLHVVVVLLILMAEGHVLLSWSNVETAVYRSDGSIAVADMMMDLLLAPMREELFFRGVLVLVGMNRLQSVKWSALISSILFAAIHLVNARHLGTQYSMNYVAFQVFWALLVGLFLALEFAISGSLVECFMLHFINNVFALGVSKTDAMDFTQPVVYMSVLLTTTIYAAAIARQVLHLLGRNITVKTNKKV
ncbi:Peptidase [Phytophthora megakarya]|uniref:Peptidase n=1 Tax=Phytophthora megakarya TaxID=4795 RepID=A0A225WQQ3_9STRA|nr:Peptidase [Phytophthora megakarya]